MSWSVKRYSNKFKNFNSFFGFIMLINKSSYWSKFLECSFHLYPLFKIFSCHVMSQFFQSLTNLYPFLIPHKFIFLQNLFKHFPNRVNIKSFVSRIDITIVFMIFVLSYQIRVLIEHLSFAVYCGPDWYKIKMLRVGSKSFFSF